MIFVLIVAGLKIDLKWINQSMHLLGCMKEILSHETILLRPQNVKLRKRLVPPE